MIPTRKAAIKRNFNRASQDYDKHAFVQREISQRLTDVLDFLKLQPKTIIDLGCSTGYTADLVQQRYPGATVIGVDMAAQLCLLAKQQRGLVSCCADAERLPIADNSVELVISNLTLQWCDFNTVAREVARILKPEGLFLFSTLGPDSLHEMRQSWLTVDNDIHVHDFVDLHNIGDTLVQNKFADPVMEMEKLTLHYATLKQLFNEVKGIGAQNVHPQQSTGLMGKQRWQRFADAYTQQQVDGYYPLTYEIIYGHAWKPEPSATVNADESGVAHFPLAYLRQRP